MHHVDVISLCLAEFIPSECDGFVSDLCRLNVFDDGGMRDKEIDNSDNQQNKQQQNEQCARNHHDSDSGAPFMRTLGWSFCGRSPADVTTVIRFDVIRKDVEIIVFV